MHPYAPRPAGKAQVRPNHHDGQHIQILLYEECELYRIGLRTLIESADDMTIAGEASSVRAAAELAGAQNPTDARGQTVALVGVADVELTASVLRSIQRDTSIPVLALATNLGHDEVLTILAAGARGILCRDTAGPKLVTAIRSVVEGGLVMTATEADSLLAHIVAPRSGRPRRAQRSEHLVAAEALTPRQREVLGLVAQGLPNLDIARSMHISVATVKSHLSYMLARFGVRDRTQLAVLVHQLGLDAGLLASPPHAAPR